MKPIRLVKVLLCIVPSVLFAGLAYWLYVQPILELQTERKAVVDRALSFLENYLWDDVNGSYREVPVFANSTLAKNHNPDDNFLSYIFHTEYIVDSTKAGRIHGLFVHDNFTSYNRWLVLSKSQANYTRYECAGCNPPTPYRDNGYADRVALDGMYYWKIGNPAGARERLNFLVAHMLDSSLGLLRDNATPTEGFVYYKIALGLMLATELANSTYSDAFSKTLWSQQNEDGSWLTGPVRPTGIYPNTETMILIIMALKLNWNL